MFYQNLNLNDNNTLVWWFSIFSKMLFKFFRLAIGILSFLEGICETDCSSPYQWKPYYRDEHKLSKINSIDKN